MQTATTPIEPITDILRGLQWAATAPMSELEPVIYRVVWLLIMIFTVKWMWKKL